MPYPIKHLIVLMLENRPFENSDDTGVTAMKNFVEDYELAGHDQIQAPNIMKCFNPDTLPVLSTLSREYAVYGRWFSSVPGPTIRNRLFTHVANYNGFLPQDAVDAPLSPVAQGYCFRD